MPRACAWRLGGRGAADRLDDEVGAALEEQVEQQAIGRRLGYREVIAYCLGGFAELAAIDKDAVRAATLLAASELLFAELGAIPSPDEAQSQQRVVDYVVATLGQERVDELRVAGEGVELDDLLEDVASRA